MFAIETGIGISEIDLAVYATALLISIHFLSRRPVTFERESGGWKFDFVKWYYTDTFQLTFL